MVVALSQNELMNWNLVDETAFEETVSWPNQIAPVLNTLKRSCLLEHLILFYYKTYNLVEWEAKVLFNSVNC